MANKLKINIDNIDYAWQANKNYTIRISPGIAQEVGNNRSLSAVQTLTNAIQVGSDNFTIVNFDQIKEVESEAKFPTVYGNLTTSTVQKKFGNSSFVFDGSGDYLKYQPADVTPWSVYIPYLGDNALFGNWTIEAWIRRNNTARTETLFDFRASTNADGPKIGFVGSSMYVRKNATAVISTATSLSTSSWYHVTVMYGGSNELALFLDGVKIGSATVAPVNEYTGPFNNDSGNNPFTIGSVGWSPSEYFSGYMDEIRVSNNTQYNMSGFTPPSSALSANEDTRLLLKAENGFSDSSTSTSLYKEYTSDSLNLDFARYIKKNTGNFTLNASEVFNSSAVVSVTSSSVTTIDGIANVSFAGQFGPSVPITGSTTSKPVTLSFPKGIVKNLFDLDNAISSSYPAGTFELELFNPYFSTAPVSFLTADPGPIGEGGPGFGWSGTWPGDAGPTNGQTGVTTTTIHLRVLGADNLFKAVPGKNFYVYKVGSPNTLVKTIASTSTGVTLISGGISRNPDLPFKPLNFIRIQSPWSYSSGDSFYLTADEGAFETVTGNKSHVINSSTFLTFTMA